MGMTVFADGTVAVFDISRFSMVVFGPDGQWIRDVRVDPEATGLPSPPFPPLPGRVLAAEVGGRISARPEVQMEPGRPVVRLPLEVEAGEPVNLLNAWEPPAPGPGDGPASLRTEGGGSIALQMPRMRAFTPELQLAVLRDGRILAVDTTSYRIGVYSSDGTFQFAIARPIAPVPLTPSIEQQERQRRLDDPGSSGGLGTLRIVTSGGGGGSIQMPDLREMMRKRVEDMVLSGDPGHRADRRGLERPDPGPAVVRHARSARAYRYHHGATGISGHAGARGASHS
jgi:hypothetical protein